MLIFHVDQVW